MCHLSFSEVLQKNCGVGNFLTFNLCIKIISYFENLELAQETGTEEQLYFPKPSLGLEIFSLDSA